MKADHHQSKAGYKDLVSHKAFFGLIDILGRYLVLQL